MKHRRVLLSAIPILGAAALVACVVATSQEVSGGTPGALSALSCTRNPDGLSFRVSQQPGKNIVPGAAGPLYSFFVEGTGFVPGETVTVVIKGRVIAPGTMGSTSETVHMDSTFATTVGGAVIQPNMPFDFYVLHRRGVACVAVTVEQVP